MRIQQRIVSLIVPMVVTVVLSAAASAQSVNSAQGIPSWEKLKVGEYIQSIAFGGDFRLRNDNRHKRGAGTNDLSQVRYRLRFGADIQLPEGFWVNTRLASGTGEQVSTNQSFGKLSGQKSIWVDTVYLRWAPMASDYGTLHLTGGRMINPLWRIYSSDLIWDDDFNPEGFAQGVEWLFPAVRLTLFANGLQAVTDQDSNASKNQWFFSQQVGAETRLPLESRLRLAAAYHKWSDENRSALTQAAIQDGNRRSSGVLLNRFGVGEVTGQLSSWVGQTLLAFQATLVRNLRAQNNGTTLTGPRARDGYQYGIIVGKASAHHTWEAAYFKKYAQTDATVADVADSDFGDGGTNRQGHIFWLAYAPRGWMQVKAKAFVTDVIDRQFTPGDKAVNRLQLDMSVKF